ncbi:MAG: hypothetical protein ABIP74_03705 [Candidatus Saccharimonas sp.]
MDNSNNEVPATEVEREDTGSSVTTAPGITPAPNPTVTDQKIAASVTGVPHKAWPQPKSNRHILRKILVPLGLLIVGAIAGVILYKLYLEPSISPVSTSTTSNSSTATPATTNQATAASLIGVIKSKMKAAEVATTNDSGSSTAMTKDANFAAFSVPYAQPTGYDFFTVPKTMSGFTVATSDYTIASVDVATARQYLVDQHFVAGSAMFDDANSISSSSEFTSDTVRCQISETSYGYKAGKYQVQVGCADISSYEETAEIIQPLYQAYVAAHAEIKIAGLMFANPIIKASAVSGYQHATVSTGNIFAPVGGSATLLYQTPDAKWHYFLNAQDAPGCSDYATTDLKKAYAGESCVMTNGQESKVTQ